MEEIIVANLTLDTYQRNKVAPLVVPHGDYGARVIRSKITNLGKPVIVESTAAVSIVATRSVDGESQAFSGSVNADGTVTVPVTQWMLDVPEEDVTCHIVVTGIGYQYSTTSFLIEPQEKANPTEISEDDPRVDVVAEVLAGENTRRAAEAERVSNENARIAAENARQSAETQRLTDEATRITNEAHRVSAESSRYATFMSWAQDIASLPTFDGRISANRKRIENLESGIPSESFIINDSVAYTKDVPENVAPNAVVQKVGGMTRKCANIWDEVAEQGCLRNGGNSTYVNSELRAINHIKVRPNTTYYTNEGIIVSYYNANKEWVQGSGSEFGYSVNAGTFTTPSDAHYMRFYTMSYGTTYNNDIIIAEGEPKPYEPYFESLRSAKVTEVKSVGANLLSEQRLIAATNAIDERGYIKFSNQFANISNTLFKSKTVYTLSFVGKIDVGNGRLAIKYTDGTVDNAIINSTTDVLVTIHSNAEKTIASIDTSYGDSGNVWIKKGTLMLNEGVTALPYTPYHEHTLSIPEAVRPANGINENVYDYIEWEEDGSVKQGVRCGVADLGTLAWQVESYYAYSFSLNPVAKSGGDLLYTNLPIGVRMSGIDTAQAVVVAFDEGRYDAASFKAAMQGVMLVYELAEPIVTDISDLITADNLIGVEGGGTLTFENEYGYAVPSTIIYQLR